MHHPSHFSCTHMPSKACETLLYPAVSHILRLVRFPGEYHISIIPFFLYAHTCLQRHVKPCYIQPYPISYALLGSQRNTINKCIIPFFLYAHAFKERHVCETLLYPAVSHILRLVRLSYHKSIIPFFLYAHAFKGM